VNYALILSGGSGTRLWPLSRKSRPKHLISLVGSKPLLEQTLDRLDGLIEPAARFLITVPEQAPIVRDAARGKAAGIIIEPVGRNNLLPMALSIRFLADRDPESTMAFLPADHSIGLPDKLKAALGHALKVATEGYIVTLGIPTRYPEPNYGHIQKGEKIQTLDKDYTAYKVKSFREKPPMESAEEWNKDKDWFWNGGIFCFSASAMMDLIEKAQPELAEILNSLAPVLARANPTIGNPVIDWESSEEIMDVYRNLPKRLQTSIDYALIEKSDKVATIPVEMDWNDLGGFSALSDFIQSDDNSNRIAPRADGGDSRVLLPGSSNSTVFPSKRAVICLDCDGIIVVDTPDAILVLPATSSQHVRAVVDQITQRGWTDLL